MTEQQQAELQKVQSRPRSRWFTFFRWPDLITTIAAELKATSDDLDRAREAHREEQSRAALLETLHQDARKETREALLKLQAEQSECTQVRIDLTGAKIEIGRHIETIRDLETLLKSAQLDAELAKVESTKTKAQLELSCAERERLAKQVADVQRKNVLASRFVHASFRLNAPPVKGIAGLLAKARSVLVALAILMPSVAAAQFPPPFWRNAWTTNVPPAAVTGQDNLSVTNLGSTTNWLFHSVRPQTIARLLDVTNIASFFLGGGLTTNANQFLGVPLSIKAGAALTNMNFFGPGTNHANMRVEGDFVVTAGDSFFEGVFPLVDDNYSLGGLLAAWLDLRVKSGGIKLVETGAGTDFVELLAPASVGASYIVRFPNVQGANMAVLTNDGSGNLGWWVPVVGDAGGTNARQFGTLSLTNLSGNPNVATNILGAGSVTVASNNLGTWTITGSLGSVFTQGVAVATSATNVDFVNGTNIAITAANSSGNVTLTIHSPTDFTNIFYVNRDSNLSQILTNAPNNSTIWIGQGDWTNSVSYSFSNGNLGMFHLRNKTNIYIKAVGKAKLWTTNEGDHLNLSNCFNIKVDGLEFEGVKVTNIAGTVSWAGIWVYGCKEVEICNNDFFAMGNHSICEGFISGGYQSTNVYVHHNRIVWGGSWINNSIFYDGTGIQCGSYWKAYQNKLIECTAPFEFFGQPDATAVVNSDVYDNYIENPVKWGIADAGATNNYGHLIARNRIVFNDGTRRFSSNAVSGSVGIDLTTPRYFRIEDNTVIGANTAGIQLRDQALFPPINNSIERNYISNSNDGIVIIEQPTDAGKHRGNRIVGNKICRMVSGGITVAGSDTWVSDNDIDDVALTFKAGIFVGWPGAFYVATNVVVINNRIRTTPGVVPTGPGIQINEGSVNCRQFNNDITGGYPIRIVDNGDVPQPSLYVEMVTGIKTNPFVIYNTNRAPVWYIDSRGFMVITNSLTNRAAAPTNTIAMGAESFGGFNLPNWTDHSGLQAALQPLIAHEHIYWLGTFTGAILGSEGIAPVTNGGTAITHSVPIETQPHMVVLSTPATSNGTASAWSSADLANAGAHNGSSKIGGYFYAATWCSTNLIHQVVGGGAPRTFVGLTSLATESFTNLVVTTNATGQYVGLMCDAKQSTNMFLTARDGSAEFRTNTGIPFIATNIYKFYMFNAPTSRFLGWRLDDAYSGASASGWFSNNVPTNFMKFGIITRNGTNRAHSVRYSRLYLQAPVSPPR